MTDKEPTLSPYDEGTDPETESFLLDAQSEPSPAEYSEPETTDAEAVASPDASALPEAPASDAGAAPAEAATRTLWASTPEEAPTTVVERPTLMDESLAGASPTDTVVRRTSLFHPDEPTAEAAPAPAPTPEPAPLPSSEFESYDDVPSRAGAHWWSLISVLILTPVAWYLLSDAGARLTLAANAPWETGVLNYAAIAELASGLLVLVVILLALKGSSLGAWITGPLLFVGGALFIAFPSQVQSFLAPYLQTLSDYNAFGGNVAHHLIADGSTGRFVIAAVVLMAVGIVSHGARRAGKRAQRIEDALAKR